MPIATVILCAVSVPVASTAKLPLPAVNAPVDVMRLAVIEPFSSTLKAPFAAVKVPVVTVILLAVTLAAVIEPVSSTLKAPLATVNVPVDTVILDAVIEPVEPTTKLLLAAVKVPVTVADPVVVNVDTVVEPAFIVPVVLILLAPPTVIPLNPEPSPENFDAVIVPFANISLRKRTVVVP